VRCLLNVLYEATFKVYISLCTDVSDGYTFFILRIFPEEFNVHGSVHRNNILIYEYIQQDATLHSLFYLKTAPYVSGGTSTQRQDRKELYLRHLVFVKLLLLPAAIAVGSSNSLTNTRR
jgi:hypothetical protein